MRRLMHHTDKNYLYRSTKYIDKLIADFDAAIRRKEENGRNKI
jgi:hypothetical protein